MALYPVLGQKTDNGYLALRLGLYPWDLKGMFSFYCDDSGTHSGSPVAVAACLISSVDRWSNFQRAWCEANAAENFGVFHMADFEGNYDRFNTLEWRDSAKKQRTLDRLIKAIRDNVEIAVGAAVVKNDYDKVVPQEIRKRYALGDNHYTFAVRTCVGHVLRWRKEHRHRQAMSYVFDRMSKGKGEIINIFDTAMEQGRGAELIDFGIAKDGWSFADKAGIVQLQGADICAWETLRFLTHTFLRPKLQQQPMRKSLATLYKNPLHLHLHNEDTLRELINWEAERNA